MMTDILNQSENAAHYVFFLIILTRLFTPDMILLQNILLHKKHSFKKVQVGKDQEKAQSERDSHSKNRGGKKPN